MVGADENSARDCGLVVDALTRLRKATPDGRGCVLGVHHTGKDAKTFRGSSAFEAGAGADTVYSTTEGGGTITVRFVLERNLNDAANDVREKVASAIKSVPPELLPPVITKVDPDADPVISLMVSSCSTRWRVAWSGPTRTRRGTAAWWSTH